MNTDLKCKICRRLGIKLFLKGARCSSQKCAMVRRAYPPGPRKKRPSRITDYGKELKEKQKLKNYYYISEKQLKRAVNEVLAQKSRTESASDMLIQKLESRLDNTVFRMGLAFSRAQARQIVGHRHITVNGKTVGIPSYTVKVGDEIAVKKPSLFKDADLKNYKAPSWISLDKEAIKGKMVAAPVAEEAGVPVEATVVFEFYSK